MQDLPVAMGSPSLASPLAQRIKAVLNATDVAALQEEMENAGAEQLDELAAVLTGLHASPTAPSMVYDWICSNHSEIGRALNFYIRRV